MSESYKANPFKHKNKNFKNNNSRSNNSNSSNKNVDRSWKRGRTRPPRARGRSSQRRQHAEDWHTNNRNYDSRSSRRNYSAFDSRPKHQSVDQWNYQQMGAQHSRIDVLNNEMQTPNNEHQNSTAGENNTRNLQKATDNTHGKQHKIFENSEEKSVNNANSSHAVENEHIILNIKTEKENTSTKAAKSSESSDSSDTDTEGSSDDSTVKDLRKNVNNTLVTKKQKPPTMLQQKPALKKEVTSSSSDSSDTDSDSKGAKDIQNTQKNSGKKNSSEEEVICLGKVERIENLIDDEDTLGSHQEGTESKACVLCDNNGHTSFQCQMICKNCNDHYHGLKDCKKPPNISLMLQYFMQFCLEQCCKYNPDEKFNLGQYDSMTNFKLPSNFDMYEKMNESDCKKSKKRKLSNDASSSISKLSKKKRNSTSTNDSNTSSEESNIEKYRRKPKSSVNNYDMGATVPQFPTHTPFTPAAFNPGLPFAFNPSTIGFNPMLAFSQMMGYNPAPIQISGNKTKKK